MQAQPVRVQVPRVQARVQLALEQARALEQTRALALARAPESESVLASAAESALASLQALALASVRLKALPLESAQELVQELALA